jgi:hypothetical protein
MPLRIIPALDEDPRIVASCSRPLGRWTLLAIFVCVLALFSQQWPWIGLWLALTTALPAYRRNIMSLLGVLFAVTRPIWLNDSLIQLISGQEGLAYLPQSIISLVVLGVFLFLSALATLAFRFPTDRIARRPVITSVLALSALVVTVSIAPLHRTSRVVAWIVVLALARMLWFFCYTLADRNSRDRDAVPQQTGLWQPVWMLGQISGVPIAKGATYLRKIEASNPGELAVTQCKALKLLLWALALRVGLIPFQFLIYQKLGVPTLPAALERSMAGNPFPWYWNWLSLIAAFFGTLLIRSVVGHQLVACVRMAGFRALRNTYRPLESRTIAEFWNRYYFYFKELLVDMFFYPTYLRYFKRFPRLRMAAATMMAACVGNAIYHFFDSISSVAELGWWRSILGFQTYLFYCFVLGAGIVISQLRGRRKTQPRPQSFLRARLLPILRVGSFYCFLQVFDDFSRTHSLGEHFAFVGHLFGL